MSARYSICFDARCPFYKGELKKDVYCEGVLENSTTIVHLTSQTAAEDYKDLYCRCDWESCAIAKGLTTKYD